MQQVVSNGLNHMNFSDYMLLEESIAFFNDEGAVQFQQEVEQESQIKENDIDCIIL